MLVKTHCLVFITEIFIQVPFFYRLLVYLINRMVKEAKDKCDKQQVGCDWISKIRDREVRFLSILS